MGHYNEEELILYSKACVDKTQEIDIEEHLLTCDECRDKYIQIVECCYMKDEDNKVSLEFADNVMNKLKHEDKPGRARKRKRIAPEIFLYYVAAACITLLFTFNGVFDSLIGGFSDMTTTIAQTPINIEKTASNGWTERLANDTSIIISRLKP